MPKDQPIQMLFGCTKSLPPSFSIVEILEFERGYSWEFSKIEKLQSAESPVLNLFRWRRLRLVSDVRPCPSRVQLFSFHLPWFRRFEPFSGVTFEGFQPTCLRDVNADFHYGGINLNLGYASNNLTSRDAPTWLQSSRVGAWRSAGFTRGLKYPHVFDHNSITWPIHAVFVSEQNLL